MRKLLPVMLVLVLLLSGCDRVVSPDNVINNIGSGDISTEPKASVVKNKIQHSSGATGNFFSISTNSIANIYTEDTTLISTDTEMLAMKFVKNTGTPTAETVKTYAGDGKVTNQFKTKSEQLYSYTIGQGDKERIGYIGFSVINKDYMWVMYGWSSKGSPTEYPEMYEKAFTDTFSKSIFTTPVISDDTTDKKTNMKSRFIYVPVGSSGYDVIFKNSAEVIKTTRGYDINIDSVRSISIEDFTVGHADINISEVQLEYEDLQMILLKDSNKLEKLVRATGTNIYKELDDGFWKSLDYTYLINSRKMYVRVYIIARDFGITSVVVKSTSPLDEKFFKEDMQFVETKDRKVKTDYSGFPLAETLVKFTNKEVAIQKINADAISAIRTVGGRYLKETFGDATYSQGYLSKQLYFKNNYANVLLPITSNMDAPEGAQSEVSCTNSVYGGEPAPIYKQASIAYQIFEVDQSGTTSNDKVIDDSLIFGFDGAVNTALSDMNEEVVSNNYVFTTNKTKTPGNVWQGEFVYKANDKDSNKAYTKSVFGYIKSLGKNCYVSVVLTYSDKVDAVTRTTFQTAFESSVRAIG